MKKYFNGNFGFEREAVRIDSQGILSTKLHPQAFTDDNPYITKDFAEAQIEMITPPCSSISEAIHFIEDIQSVVLETLNDEYLWNQSNPPILIEDKVYTATFKDDPKKKEYRDYLAKKYGYEKSIISGIHFNYSLSEKLLTELFNEQDEFIVYSEFVNHTYLKLAKYILRYRFLFMYLTNSSPVFHDSYYEHCVNNSQRFDNGDCVLKGMNSLRNSVCGYRNTESYLLNYSSLKAYRQSIDDVVKEGSIIGPTELYTPVRLKENKMRNIEYLEMRFIDIFPFSNSGISQLDMEYIHLFLVYALFQDDFEYTEDLQKSANEKQDSVSNTEGSDLEKIKKEMLHIHHKLVMFYKDKTTVYDQEAIFADVYARIHKEQLTYAMRLKEAYQQTSYIDYHVKQAKVIKEEHILKPYVYSYKPQLELSTKILLKQCIKDAYLFDIVDEASNFIEITHPQSLRQERVVQATKTNLDAYANVLAMENKQVTKKILEQHEILTPSGYVVFSADDVDNIDLSTFSKGIVIKPNSTNFGIGITILKDKVTDRDVKKAVTHALSFDDSVIIEHYLAGKEYRFLIIDETCVAVLHREAAHVVGDGKHTIQELINIKNDHPFRSKNYVSPLELIEIDDLVLDLLKRQRLTLNSIIDKNQKVYLRENSNISTGGDSIDVTDEVDLSYKVLALEAAKALDVSISGVDMIIRDIHEPATLDNYGILEMNFNPAIHIHTYPLVGKNRYPAEAILRALFKKNK